MNILNTPENMIESMEKNILDKLTKHGVPKEHAACIILNIKNANYSLFLNKIKHRRGE